MHARPPRLFLLGAAALALLLAGTWGCATTRPPVVRGPDAPPSETAEDEPPPTVGHRAVEVGLASFYAREHQGRRTASGEAFDMNAMTAAHRTLPFGTRVSVTNLENGRSAVVRVNDRGPFGRGRIIDLSYAAARRLGMVGRGTARVRLEVL